MKNFGVSMEHMLRTEIIDSIFPDRLSLLAQHITLPLLLNTFPSAPCCFSMSAEIQIEGYTKKEDNKAMNVLGIQFLWSSSASCSLVFCLNERVQWVAFLNY